MTPIQIEKHDQTSSLLLGITKALLASAVFLTPTFFLPGLNDVTELPKAALFLFLTLSAATAYVGFQVSSRDLRWRNVVGGWWLLGFVVVVILSSVWSIGHMTTLFGQGGYVQHTLPLLLGFVLFVLLLTQVLEREEDVAHMVFVLALSTSLGVLLGVLQMSGISPLPWQELRTQNFLVTGNSSSGFAMVAAALVTTMLFVLRGMRGMLWRILGWAGFGFSLLALIAVDSIGGWVALIVGVAVAIAFASLRRISRFELVAGIAAVVIAVVGIVLPVNGWIGSAVGQDLRLDVGTSWAVTKATIAQHPLLGSGPATFFYDFTRFQPASYNLSPFSPLRFLKASDESLQLLATLGILGALALAGLVLWVLFAVTRRSEELARSRQNDWHVVSAVVGMWSGTTAALLFVPSTFTTFALFWITLGMLLVVFRRSSSARSVRPTALRIGGGFSFLVVVVFLVVTTVWSVRLLLADRGMHRVSAAVQQAENLDSVMEKIDRVITLNPSAPLPYLFRAQSELIQAQVLIQAQSTETVKIQTLLTRVVPDAETAVSRDPRNPAILETAADLYKNLGAVTGNTGDLVVSAYERALKLQPNSASLRVNLGQTQYFIAAALKNEQGRDNDEVRSRIIKARSEFTTALELQPGNVNAGFGLVLVDELSGENDAAFNRLNNLTQANPRSASLWHELGLRFVDRKDTASAKGAFTNAVILQPSLTQAHWELGLIAEQEKDVATARKEFELVQQLDPTNQEVGKKLEGLPK